MRKSSHPKILESATRNHPAKPVLQHSVTSPAGGDSVFSRAWSDVSQVNPERDKISNFDGNKFIIQNLNFYRQQYQQAFRFREPHPTNQIICNNIDDGDVLSQQYLQRVIADSSVPVVEPLQTTSGGASIMQEFTTAAPDYELQSLWATRNIHSVFNCSQRRTLTITKSTNITETGLWLMRQFLRP